MNNMILTSSLGKRISSNLFIIYQFKEFVADFFRSLLRRIARQKHLLQNKLCTKIINETFARAYLIVTMFYHNDYKDFWILE